MKSTEELLNLLSDKEFIKKLLACNSLTGRGKASFFHAYMLSKEEAEIIRKLWAGLDFRRGELPAAVIESALNETVWKLAERNSLPAERTLLQKMYDRFARVAALLLIPLLIYAVYGRFFSFGPDWEGDEDRLITVCSQPGTVTNLVLPDGSRVWLNSGSSLSYPSEFQGKTREVSLSGEAYFEVERNSRVPLVVTAGGMFVHVYGTTFNVCAFPVESSGKVTLVEGAVSLTSGAGKFDGKNEYFMSPGQTVVFEKTCRTL
ncbi:MAG: FecR family protein, partial [Mangrovibacterium sp.]